MSSFICNRSNWTITHAFDEAGQYFPFNPPIGRTCSYDTRKQCVDEGKFQQVLSVNCHDDPFYYGLRVSHPGYGIGDTNMARVIPDCRFTGEIVFLELQDP